MSKNPFTTTNNRFKFLDEDENDKASMFRPVKKEKKSEVYESSNNSFTKEREKSSFNNYKRNNSSNRINKEANIVKETQIFNIEEIEFPEIVSNTKTSETSSIFNFKDALKKQNETLKNDLNENKIKPGWIELSLENKKIVSKEGPFTPYLLRQLEIEEYEETPHYIMNKACIEMNKNRVRYIEEYNSIHGDGAFEEKYILPPVYGPEYDTEDDLTESCESDDNSEL